MDDEASEVDEEEVVCVPKELKVVPADELGGGCDHEDECQRDDHPRQPRDGRESHILDGLRGEQGGLRGQGTGGGGLLDAKAVLTVWLEWMGFSHLLLPCRCILERTAGRLPSVACWFWL